MTFRRRIVLLAAAAVAVAIALAVTITYIIVRHDLRASVDSALRGTRPEVVLLGKDGPPGMAPPVRDEERTAAARRPRPGPQRRVRRRHRRGAGDAGRRRDDPRATRARSCR